MRVASLWRHPVKSLQGEALAEADVRENGVAFDRWGGIRSAATGHILPARRTPELLHASATVDGGEPLVTLPDGTVVRGTGATTDAALSAWLGEDVSLVEASQEPPSV